MNNLLERSQYTRSIQKDKESQRIQSSSNSAWELMESLPKPLTHSYNNWKNWIFKSGMDNSVSSKWRTFLSLHKHQMTQWGAALHTSVFLWLPKGPCQVEKRSKTVLGITQKTPNKPNTKSHSSRAILQWSKRWSGLSPLSLHKQHHSTKYHKF